MRSLSVLVEQMRNFKGTKVCSDLGKRMVHWGYESYNGPSKWATLFPQIACYCNQSPIDIDTAKAVPHESSGGFRRNYWRCENAMATNNGHSFEVSCADPRFMTITGGPLGDSLYQFKQFHFHWGAKGELGSEHTIDGRRFDGEIHFVHWNSSAFGSFEDAVNSGQSDGLCVLGVLFKVEERNLVINQAFSRLAKRARKVQQLKQTSPFTRPLGLKKLFPTNLTYYTYSGSLTTPPCTECVRWIVYDHPIEVRSNWIDTFRAMERSTNGCLIDRNYRPIQPLNGRIILKYCDCSKEISSSDSSSSSSSDR
ncbi:hypothetical protein ACOME3_001214 [Neoechinorhynchus agilis]